MVGGNEEPSAWGDLNVCRTATSAKAWQFQSEVSASSCEQQRRADAGRLAGIRAHRPAFLPCCKDMRSAFRELLSEKGYEQYTGWMRKEYRDCHSRSRRHSWRESPHARLSDTPARMQHRKERLCGERVLPIDKPEVVAVYLSTLLFGAIAMLVVVGEALLEVAQAVAPCEPRHFDIVVPKQRRVSPCLKTLQQRAVRSH
jgi:hypothetical protein